MFMSDALRAARFRALALAGLRRPQSPFQELPSRFLVADVAEQRLGLLEQGVLAADFVISTAAAGLGCEEGSFRTPPGWHRIHGAFGAGARYGAIFRNRADTGETWEGDPRAEDLILTRILTLDGLEEGVNRGPGRDSLERTIYIHGTNQEHLLGTPVSHGCLRLGNLEMLELFGSVAPGDLVLISEGRGEGLGPLGLGRLHFTGLAGSGMSALAQFAALCGGSVSGSDRAFDRSERGGARAQLEGLGIAVAAQDGSGVDGDCAAVIHSTAVEDTVPDVVAARHRGVPLVHRSELLAHLVAARRTVAVTGTSGKSTVAAMIFEILRGAGADPSLITGGELCALQAEGLWGNAWVGKSDLLVIEADESDGSLVRYEPAVGVLLNLQRDHKEPAQVAEMFDTFRGRVREALVVGEDPALSAFAAGATVFGFEAGALVRGLDVATEGGGSSFQVDGVAFRLPHPGRHNVANALAAIAACRTLGVGLDAMVGPLARFQGVARRFQSLGTRRGIEVVDDFAHNPAKVAASLRAARLRAQRVLAVYQPHGYAPTRFLRQEFVATFARELAPSDRLWWLEVYYAGGSAQRDFSSANIVAEIVAQGASAAFAPSRDWLVARIAEEARAGDLVLVMGARDPSLSDLARDILAAL